MLQKHDTRPIPKWIQQAFPPDVRPHWVWIYVEIGKPDDCWPWLGANKVAWKNAKNEGYGRFRYNGKIQLAHRVCYAIANNFDLEELEHVLILHSCDNPICCNPRHLSEGTHAINAAQRMERGRYGLQRGEQIHTALLTEKQVRRIKQLLNTGKTHRALAEKYGVGPATISAIASGRNWGWLK